MAASPHVLLYNPLPLQQEWSFLSPRNDTQVPQQKNQGTIIGRIYFLRAEPPAFKDELERWSRDIPNSLANLGGSKSTISSRTLVYNSVAFSALLTGLITFLILEFAYYLMRHSQEKESRAVAEKQIAEQKLHATQSRLRQAQIQAEHAAEKSGNAILKQQESEQKAREAAIQYEQALREKEQAEAAAEDISQQLLQQREFTNQALRLAMEKSEQAWYEKRHLRSSPNWQRLKARKPNVKKPKLRNS
ncbi:MAG: hypothetical protein HC919_04160 [Oscillatoriales cyanobacterium SM2_2_1]|nr:hypothetical protein [Oscillatoriales cyanobacterium SM2_2_1]